MMTEFNSFNIKKISSDLQPNLPPFNSVWIQPAKEEWWLEPHQCWRKRGKHLAELCLCLVFVAPLLLVQCAQQQMKLHFIRNVFSSCLAQNVKDFCVEILIRPYTFHSQVKRWYIAFGGGLRDLRIHPEEDSECFGEHLNLNTRKAAHPCSRRATTWSFFCALMAWWSRFPLQLPS